MDQPETYQEEGAEHHLEAPTLTAGQRERIVSEIPQTRHTLTQLLHWYDVLREQNPELFGNIAVRHPQMITRLEGVRVAAEYLSERNTDLGDEELVQAVDDYNFYANAMNDVLGMIRREGREEEQRFLEQAARGELNFDENEYTEAEKTELRNFVRDAWNELFPPTHTERFFRWVTETRGHVDWQGWQRMVIAPAAGIENVVMGFIDMLKPRTYVEFVHAFQNLYDMGFEGALNMWRVTKYAVEELPLSDTVSPAISLLVAMCTLWGGVAKIGAIARKLGYSPRVMRTLRMVASGRTATHVAHAAHNVLPVAMMTEAVLPYLGY